MQNTLQCSMPECKLGFRMWPQTCRSHSVAERNCSRNSSLDHTDRQCLLQGRGAKVFFRVKGSVFIMVVAELLQWGAPLQLILCVVLLASHEKALQAEDRNILR